MELSLSLVGNVGKIHFAKEYPITCIEKNKKKSLLVHNWRMEVSRTSNHLLSDGKICKMNKPFAFSKLTPLAKVSASTRLGMIF